MKLKKQNLLKWLPALALLVALPLVGTAGIKDVFKKKPDANALYQDAYLKGNYAGALDIGLKDAGKKISEKSQILWQLHAGSAAYLAGKPEQAIELFGYADNAFRESDSESKAKTGMKKALSFVSTEKANSYKGKIYERIMLNTYKGIYRLTTSDFEKAHIEFSLMRDWQDKAEEYFAKEIAKAEDKAKESEEKNTALEPESVLGQLKFGEKSFDDEFLGGSAFQPYKDFYNPYANWFAGLAAMLSKNAKADDADTVLADRAATYLRAVSQMVPENKYVSEDAKAASSDKAVANRVWVVIENGLCADLVEEKTQLPLMLPVGKSKSGEVESALITCVFAFPKLMASEPAQKSFYVEAAGQRHESELLCNMDRVMQTEYNKTIKGIAVREVSRTLVKTVAQYAISQKAAKQGGGLASMGASIVAGAAADAMTSADTRQWAALPKDVYVASLPIPEGRKITLGCETTKMTVDIPACKNAIVYYCIPTTPDKAPAPRVVTFN